MKKDDELRFLARDIARRRAFVYVGAGVSQSAGLPGWTDLLNSLRKQISFEDDADSDYFNNIFTRSKNLEVADWLQELLGDERLAGEVKRNLERHATPSRVHHNIARIPFNMALTTNYDNLLTNAFRSAERDADRLMEGIHDVSGEPARLEEPLPFDWSNADGVLGAVRDLRRFILHVHGNKDHDTIVLSDRQYQRQMYQNRAFRDLLKWIFTSNTCLFVGASLEDPDLLYVLHEAKAEYGKNFGPHYALIPGEEAPPQRKKILRSNLNIVVIPLELTKEIKRKSQEADTDWLSIAVSEVLVNLSGEVALQQLEVAAPVLPTSDDKAFYLRKALRKLLAQVCRLTGSFRGDFCFSAGGPGRNMGGQLLYEEVCGPTLPYVKDVPVSRSSVCGTAYYNASLESGIYLENVNKLQLSPESDLSIYGKLEYVAGDGNVQSELAVPVSADGMRVGVLNIESRLPHAYCEAHRKVAIRFAEKAGRLYAATGHLNRRTRRLDPRCIEDAYSQLSTLIKDLISVRNDNPNSTHDPAFFIYQANYHDGTLRTQHPRTTVSDSGDTLLNHDVSECRLDDEQVLPVQVLLDGRPLTFEEASKALRAWRLPKLLAKRLGINGAVVAFPISIRGHVAGVMIVWRQLGSAGDLDGRDIELFRRASHLIANLSNTAIGFKSRAKGYSAGSFTYPNIAAASNIVKLFTTPVASESSSQDRYMDDIGRQFQEEIAAVIKRFLVSLENEESKFLSDQGMDKFPTSWTALKRCRCWIRLNTAGPSDLPCFLCVLQVSIRNERDINLFDIPNLDGQRAIASTPFPRWSQLPASTPTRANAAVFRGAAYREAEVVLNGGTSQAVVFENNPHPSALLSRIRVDRFSRVQRPKEVGRDILANVLHKDPTRAWFVVPVVLGDEHEWERGQ